MTGQTNSSRLFIYNNIIVLKELKKTELKKSDAGGENGSNERVQAI